jgi:hypothetical protein
VASIETRTTKAGTRRYIVRYRLNGKTAERPFKNRKAAREYQTRLEAEAQTARSSTRGPAPARSTTMSPPGCPVAWSRVDR